MHYQPEMLKLSFGRLYTCIIEYVVLILRELKIVEYALLLICDPHLNCGIFIF